MRLQSTDSAGAPIDVARAEDAQENVEKAAEGEEMKEEPKEETTASVSNSLVNKIIQNRLKRELQRTVWTSECWQLAKQRVTLLSDMLKLIDPAKDLDIPVEAWPEKQACLLLCTLLSAVHDDVSAAAASENLK